MKFFVFSLLFLCQLSANLNPDYDPFCDSMSCHSAAIDPSKNIKQIGYFSKRAPKIIHQIWFGNPKSIDQDRLALWKVYAERFGYDYILWSEVDDLELGLFMLPENHQLMLDFRGRGNLWSASDVLRYELLKQFGGVYIDVDFYPPSNENGFVDLEDILSFQGLTMMTELYGRNVGATALFAANGFMIAAPNHPVVCALVDQVRVNARNWEKEVGQCWPMYETGPFFLNKVLSGCFNIVPCTYLKAFNMYDWDWSPIKDSQNI